MKKTSRTTEQPPVSGDVARTSTRAAADVGLVYVTDAEPGIHRVRAGKGFAYRNPNGHRVTDEKVLARIRALAIPPAYIDVWISTHACGHLQASGRDARGRKQYRYHKRWHALRGADKFARLAEFGAALPRLRRHLRHDLRLPGLPREKVLAVAVSLLADTLIRVGNTEYARSNRSYGLTTLRDRHAAFLRDGRVRLQFRGKSGQPHDIVVKDARLRRILMSCHDLPGQALFQYLDDDGKRQPIDSEMVNDYLHAAMGDAFSAKDFRTWGGTLLALALLARTPLPRRGGERALAAAIAGVVKDVALDLRNTPAVCRNSYIHPGVFDAWREGELQHHADSVMHPRQLESLALRVLKKDVCRRNTVRRIKPG